MNPVVQALERAKRDAQLAEYEHKEAELTAAIVNILGGCRSQDESPRTAEVLNRFRIWCERNRVRYRPAQPATLAQYVLEHAAVGTAELAEIVAAISRSYFARGLPNPVATWMVAAAMERVGDTAPPRSWPKGLKAQFALLPPTLKKFIADHDTQREKVLRRAQNDAARAKRALAAAQARLQEVNLGEIDGKQDSQ